MTDFPLRAVLFDLDDTLYNRRAAFGRWADGFLRRRLNLADGPEREEVLAWITSLDANGYGSKQAVFEALHRRFPMLSGSAETSIERFYEEMVAEISLERETEELLEALERAEIPFGVVTNGSARQWRKIERLALAARTGCLFVSETFGDRKPDAAIFLAAAACLGVEPPNVLFVGDHPTNDILGAQAVGMKTAWLPQGQTWPHADPQVTPDFILDDLGRLKGILFDVV